MIRPALLILTTASALMMSACVVAPYGHPVRGDAVYETDDDVATGAPPASIVDPHVVAAHPAPVTAGSHATGNPWVAAGTCGVVGGPSEGLLARLK